MARKRVLSKTTDAVTKDDSILNDILVDSLNKKLGMLPLSLVRATALQKQKSGYLLDQLF